MLGVTTISGSIACSVTGSITIAVVGSVTIAAATSAAGSVIASKLSIAGNPVLDSNIAIVLGAEVAGIAVVGAKV